MEPLTITKEMTEEEMTHNFINYIQEFGLGFHPDTPADDYITDSDAPLFSVSQQKVFDESIQILFDAFGDALYDICHGTLFQLIDWEATNE